MKRHSYISTQRQRQANDRKQITMLLGIGQEEYWDMVMDYGRRYQAEVLDLDEWGCWILDEYSEYWSWWVNNWMRRDHRFLLRYGKTRVLPSQMLETYQYHHDPLRLTEYPNRAILEVTYDQMISSIKQVQREKSTEK